MLRANSSIWHIEKRTGIIDNFLILWYDTYNNRERVMFMVTAAVTKATECIYSIDDAMEVLFHKLDEAIDDMESGKVQTVEDAWKEIDSI